MADWAEFFQKEDLARNARSEARAREFEQMQALRLQDYWAKQGNQLGAVGGDPFKAETTRSNTINAYTNRAKMIQDRVKGIVTNIQNDMDIRNLSPQDRELEWQQKFKPLVSRALQEYGPEVQMPDATWGEVSLSVNPEQSLAHRQGMAKAEKTGQFEAGVMNDPTGTIITKDPQGGFTSNVPQFGGGGGGGGGGGIRYPGPPAPATGQATVGQEAAAEPSMPRVAAAPGSPLDMQYKRAEADRQQQEFARQQADTQHKIKVAEIKGSVTDTFNSRTKTIQEVRGALQDIRQLSKKVLSPTGGKQNATAGIALATKTAKLLDPETGVKQEELRNILEGNLPLFDRVEKLRAQLASGNMAMTQGQINDLLQVADALEKSNYQKYNDIRDQVRNATQARFKGIPGMDFDISDVVPDYHGKMNSSEDLYKAYKEDKISKEMALQIATERGW